MSWKIFYSQKSEIDLRGIYEYIAYNLCVPTAAKNQIRAIMREISMLDENPLRFPVYKNEPWSSMGLRSFHINNYVVFYLPDETKKTVTVVRIMYGYRDINKELGN